MTKRLLCIITLIILALCCTFVSCDDNTTDKCTHQFGNWKTTDIGDCGTNTKGTRERTCVLCGEKESSQFTRSHIQTFVVTKKATCTEDGEKEERCANCTTSFGTQAIPKTGHSFVSLSTVKAATCLEDGLKKGLCKNCDEIITEVITARGYHNFPDDWKIVKVATFLETGLQERTCETCGEKETAEIPVKVPEYNVILPEMPITVHELYSSGNIRTSLEITSFEFEKITKWNGEVDAFVFNWSAKKTYDIMGPNHSSKCYLGWKLYDSEGCVVGTGSHSTVSLQQGEKFKNQQFTVTIRYLDLDLDPNETYTLVLLNYQN